jgi:hypothetical protein
MNGERRQGLEGYCDGSVQAVLCAYTVRIFVKLNRSCPGETRESVGRVRDSVEMIIPQLPFINRAKQGERRELP